MVWEIKGSDISCTMSICETSWWTRHQWCLQAIWSHTNVVLISPLSHWEIPNPPRRHPSREARAMASGFEMRGSARLEKLSYFKTHCNHDATKCYKYLADTEWRKRWWFHQRYDAYRQQATFSTGVATFLFYSNCPTFRATATLQLSMNRVAPPRGPSKWCPPWNGLSACVSCYLDLVCWSVKVFDIG